MSCSGGKTSRWGGGHRSGVTERGLHVDSRISNVAIPELCFWEWAMDPGRQRPLGGPRMLVEPALTSVCSVPGPGSRGEGSEGGKAH